MATSIAVAYGDGIGPDIMESTLKILKEAGAELEIETIEIGEKLYEKGYTTGISPQSWEALRRHNVMLKAPITTPQGGGVKSLNVTIRKGFGLFANIRPVRSFYPIVKSLHKDMDCVIVRENEEDIYAGIEYSFTANTNAAIKVITKTGSEKICRYAFEFARRNGRKKVTCMSKDNIMKMADGLFHDTFIEVAKEYPDIENEHYIIDIGSARIASKPELFDVVVTENLYGDIISDIAADISGSVGMAGSANIGMNFAMFEAIHGSAPTMTGQNRANPSGLLNGAIMMLVHIGQNEVAERVENAWLATIENGYHTGDVYQEGVSKEKLGTKEFTDAVIKHIGQKPQKFTPADYTSKADNSPMKLDVTPITATSKKLVGCDFFIEWKGTAGELGKLIEEKAAAADNLKFSLISYKGMKIYPDMSSDEQYSDFWRIRYRSDNDEQDVARGSVIKIMEMLDTAGVEVSSAIYLFYYDGKRAYSLAQGE